MHERERVNVFVYVCIRIGTLPNVVSGSVRYHPPRLARQCSPVHATFISFRPRQRLSSARALDVRLAVQARLEGGTLGLRFVHAVDVDTHQPQLGRVELSQPAHTAEATLSDAGRRDPTLTRVSACVRVGAGADENKQAATTPPPQHAKHRRGLTSDRWASNGGPSTM
jgi:hypothetical protein